MAESRTGSMLDWTTEQRLARRPDFVYPAFVAELDSESALAKIRNPKSGIARP